MRLIFILLTLFIANHSFSQDILKKKINLVENGLTLQKTVPAGLDIQFHNLQERMKYYLVPGISVAVIENGKIHWSKTYGVEDINSNSPVKKNTLFQSASISKVFAAVAALKLVEEGKLDLDENVNEKLVRWKVTENQFTQKNPVTLRYLLSHSAGLIDDYGFAGYAPKNEIPTLLQVIKNENPSKDKKALTIHTVPGEVERYSGGGYLIIQLLIEDVTSQSFESYVKKTILDPVGMSNSTFDYQPDEQGYEIASAHRENGKSFKGKQYNIYPQSAAAGLWTTAEDVAKFIIELQKEYAGESDLILNQRTVKDLMTPQINQKGLGVNLKGLDKPQAFWHAGLNLGFTGVFYGLLEKKEGAVILANSEGGVNLIQEFITSVARAYNWPVMQSIKCQKIPDELIINMIGTYEDPESKTQVIIQRVGNGVAGRRSDSNQPISIFRIGEDHYTFKDSQDYFRLIFDFRENRGDLDFTESIGRQVYLKKIKK